MTSPMRRGTCGALLGVAVVMGLAGMAAAQGTLPNRGLVNFETPHVHPIDLTPDGLTLLAVNTPDNRLEVFDLIDGLPVHRVSIAVGLDPVSVRARSATHAWVVNHLSDTLSIVDTTRGTVERTLTTRDEPWDVVFAGGGGGGGGPTKAYVSTGTFNTVQVFNLGSLTTAPTSVVIDGEQPRGLAVSPDGSRVYVAVFESGNRTTILGGGSSGMGTVDFPPNVVSDPLGPYGGQNPPPNAGSGFSPPLSSDAASTIAVGLIVRQNGAGAWMDDNAHDWTPLVSGAQAARSGRPVGWTLTDHDCAVIDTTNDSVTYRDGLMTMGMAIGVNAVTGDIHMVGTEARNEVRFEPNIKSRFATVVHARMPAAGGAPQMSDLNSHLPGTGTVVPQSVRNRSIGDPRGIAVDPTNSDVVYVAGMGSNNLLRTTPAGMRMGDPIEMPEGPTGLVLSADGSRLYVLCKFAATISVVDTAQWVEIDRAALFDPSPRAIKQGRKHLYNTHKNSGLGQLACASCHVDGKTDRLAWDLGNPADESAELTDRNLGFGLFGLEPGTTQVPYLAYHPMKGPMLTQTFVDIVGHEPLHWRGDRLGLEEFNGAFIGLQGDDTNLTATEMQEFEDFLATIAFPPNPFRNFDNSLPTNLPLTGHFRTGRFGGAGQPMPNGNASAGLTLYRDQVRRVDGGGGFACVTCHTLPTGMGPDLTRANPVSGPYTAIPVGPMGERHLALVSVDGSTNTAIKIPHLRNLYKRRGFNTTQTVNRNGFGLLHNGSVDSIERFVTEPAFDVRSEQEVANLVAFMLAFSGSALPVGSLTNIVEPLGPASKDAHALVGAQLTIATNPPETAANTRLSQFVAQANLARVGLVARLATGGRQRGYVYMNPLFQADRGGETLTAAQLLALAGPTSEVTFTVVPKGTEVRIGIDRDGDGALDGDEPIVCADPADPQSFPGGPGNIDFNGDLFIEPGDLDDFITSYFSGTEIERARCDFNADGFVEPGDLDEFITRYFEGCP
ncbi:MAG: YncE family protein [Phycisphaerales bacterium]